MLSSIVAGTETAPGSGEHDCGRGVVGVRVVESDGNIVDQLTIHGIQTLRTVQGDRSHSVTGEVTHHGLVLTFAHRLPFSARVVGRPTPSTVRRDHRGRSAGRHMTTIGALLAERAKSHPDKCFVRFADEELSFSAIHQWSDHLAAQFAQLGIRRGDLVPLMMPNRQEFVASWFALCKLGAVATLINTATRGPR